MYRVPFQKIHYEHFPFQKQSRGFSQNYASTSKDNVELKRNNIKRPPLPECCQHKARHQWHGGPKTNANGKKGCRPTYRPAQLVSNQRARANVLFHTVNTETPTSTFTSRAQEEPSPIPWALKSVRHCGVVQDGGAWHVSRDACACVCIRATTCITKTRVHLRHSVLFTQHSGRECEQQQVATLPPRWAIGHPKSKGLQNDAASP